MYYLLILTFLFFSGNTEAGELWTKYDLSYPINCLSGHENYIWVGTENGGILKINRKDGTNTQYSAEKDSIGNNNIKYIAIDGSGSVFAGTSSNGLCFYENNLWKLFKKGTDGLGGNNIAGICVDNDNTFWVALNDLYSVGTGDSIYIIGQQMIQYYENSYWLTKIISSQSKKYYNGNFHFFPNNIYLFDIVNSELYSYAYYTEEGYLSNLVLKSDVIRDGITANDGNFYFGFSNIKIESKNNNHAIFWIYSGDDILYREYEVEIISDKLIGVKDWKVLNSPISSLSHYNSLFLLYKVPFIIDQSHNKWFVDRDQSNNKYLIKYDDVNYLPFTCPSWTDSTEITCLYADEKGFIWVGTQSDGLWRFDANNATSVETAKQSPASFTLSTAYPNPFNASTTISFTLNQPGIVSLAVYNLTGQKVRELAEGNYSAGSHTAVWDGRDDSGNAVSSGVYLARMESDGVSKVVRMAMVK